MSLEGHSQNRFAFRFLQVGGGDSFPVQRDCNHRHDSGQFIGGSLVDNVFSVGLPGQRAILQREGFISAQVFNPCQERPVCNRLQAVCVFQPDIVRKGVHRSVGAGHHIYFFLFDCFRRRGNAAENHQDREDQ